MKRFVCMFFFLVVIHIPKILTILIQIVSTLQMRRRQPQKPPDGGPSAPEQDYLDEHYWRRWRWLELLCESVQTGNREEGRDGGGNGSSRGISVPLTWTTGSIKARARRVWRLRIFKHKRIHPGCWKGANSTKCLVPARTALAASLLARIPAGCSLTQLPAPSLFHRTRSVASSWLAIFSYWLPRSADCLFVFSACQPVQVAIYNNSNCVSRS